MPVGWNNLVAKQNHQVKFTFTDGSEATVTMVNDLDEDELTEKLNAWRTQMGVEGLKYEILTSN